MAESKKTTSSVKERHKKATDLIVSKQRSYVVAKGNELIQHSKYDMSLQQLKVLNYIVSRIKPEDTIDKEYTITIKNYCRLCGIDDESGKNYKMIKEQLSSIANKSLWVQTEKGKYELFRWFDKVQVNENSGTLTVTFHSLCEGFLFGLESKYTQYQLQSILPMQSKYSVRMYEYCSSIRNIGEVIISIDDLKMRLGVVTEDEKGNITVQQYGKWSHFKERVLDRAVEEINKYTDMHVEYDLLKEGRKFSQIILHITNPTEEESLNNHLRVMEALDKKNASQVETESQD